MSIRQELAMLTRNDLDHESVIRKAVNHIDKLESEQSGWISIDDRLPDESGKVVMISGGVGYYSNNVWYSYMAEDAHKPIQWNVTHWQPLPSPPEAKEKDNE